MGTVTDSVATAVDEGLLPRGGTVLVACSGGADSTALTIAAARCPDFRTVVGHVDHGLRPESAAESDRVRSLGQMLRVPVLVERLSGLPVREQGLEAAAREGRYAALARLAVQAGATVVATAHTRRDQAETVLLRLFRGAGPGALAGVRKRRPLAEGVELVRPLLQVSRAETEALCRDAGITWLDDPHNADAARTRARLRKLWPLLLEFNPNLEQALASTAALAADEDELLTSLLPPDLRIETLTALPKPLQRRALLAAASLAGVRPEQKHLEQLRALIGKGRGQLDLPGGRAILAGGELIFRAAEKVERNGPRPAASHGTGDSNSG